MCLERVYMVQEFDFNMMKISEIIKRVTQICRSLHVVRLDLFGSFATGTATSRSDVDFVVYGEVDHEALEESEEKHRGGSSGRFCVRRYSTEL